MDVIYLLNTSTCCLYDSVRILTVRTVNQTYCTVCTVDQTSKLKFSQNIEVEALQFGKIEAIFYEDLSETSTSTLKGYTDTSSSLESKDAEV